MKIDWYKPYFKTPYLMGPNGVRLLSELLASCPLELAGDSVVLDLGCGSGLTSLFLAKETGASVYAADLWITEEENRRRFADWHMEDRIHPVHADAAQLPFAPEMFDAVVSVDSYHYFGGTEGFLERHILPFVKPGGTVLIAVPGIRNAYDGRSAELLGPWLGEDAEKLQSAAFWEKTIGRGAQLASMRTWQMAAFELPWQEWFATGHEYAAQDAAFYDSIIRPYTAFVGIAVRKL